MKIKQTSNIEAVREILGAASKKEIRLGFFEGDNYITESGKETPVAYIAAIQEFGYPAGNIPPRSFMRTTEVEKKESWGNNIAGALADAIEKKSIAVLNNNLNQVGAAGAADIQLTIRKIQSPPLSDATIYNRQHRKNRKTSSTKPLIDSGKMLQSVKYEVADK